MSDDPQQPWWSGPFWQPPDTPPDDAHSRAEGPLDLADAATERIPTLGASAAQSRSLAAYMDGEPTQVLPALDDRDLADVATAALPTLATTRRGVWDETTQVVAALPRRAERARVEAPRTPAGLWLPSARLKVIGARVALVSALCALGIRAGLASLGFMAPGGEIVGWSRQPVVHHLNPAPHVTQQLTPDEYASLLVTQMSLNDKLGQMMIVQFSGTDLNPDLVNMIATQGAGGVLFFPGNIESGNQLRALTANLQRLAAVPLFIAVDQEGGRVNRFEPILGPLPSAASLQTPADARDRGVQDAVLLHGFGFNLNLAPVVDVGLANPQLYERTFGTDPVRVAEMAGAYIDGLQASGQVTAVPKHFPGGLGSITTDPHLGMPTLLRSRAEWEATDVAPYEALFATHDVRGVMISHEMIPAVDPNLPTSLSPAIGTQTLRDQLGFQGVAITDDLVSMDAITVRWTVAQASVLAIIAGSDIVTAPSYSNLVTKIKDEIKAALQDGRLTRTRIDESVRRILALKIKMGLIPLPAAATPTSAPQATPQGAMPNVAWRRQRAA
jgi:beta-N-acetylhexosaminidase